MYRFSLYGKNQKKNQKAKKKSLEFFLATLFFLAGYVSGFSGSIKFNPDFQKSLNFYFYLSNF
jgi:hypothetical protein